MAKLLFYFVLLFCFTLSGFSNDFYYNNGKKVEVYKLNKNRVINNKNIKYYQTKLGEKIGVSNDILVKCHDNINCKEYLKRFNFIVIKNITDTIFLITISDDQDIFKQSVILYDDNNIKFAHPNLLKKRRKR